jgi:excisionase family DNA binding protein
LPESTTPYGSHEAGWPLLAFAIGLDGVSTDATRNLREPDDGWAIAADIMTAAEVAEYLQLPVRSVHAYAARGELPCTQIGRHRRFSRAAIEGLVAREPA